MRLMKVARGPRRVVRFSAPSAVLILGLVAGATARAPSTIEVEVVAKPRVIVLTDITNEPDDQQSLVRFLVYSNEFDVEGIVATTSTWLRNQVRPDRIVELVEAYGRVRDNLLRHAPGYPTEEHLLSITKAHLPLYGLDGVGEGKSSDGSRLIVEAVDRDDDRPVWITVWGGVNCLAQALWDVRESRTADEVDRFVSRLRVYTISDQDDAGRWLRLEFPGLFYIVSPSDERGGEYHKATWTGISGDRYYRNGPMHRFELVDNPWLEENIIRGHGPLGALYPPTVYIMEGDTPSFLGLINNGLGSVLSPAYGGWGGRYQLYRTYAENRPIWTNARESRDEVTAENGCTHTSDQATIWRWREAYQHDFAARMDWCVAERFEDANHNPRVVVNGYEGKDVLRMRVSPGDEVTLGAAGTTDPDGDKLFFRWFVYREAGNHPGEVELSGAATPEARLRVPNGDRPREVHVILEVRDDGEPSLHAYRRVILEVEPR
jgi:hypothetical protein